MPFMPHEAVDSNIKWVAACARADATERATADAAAKRAAADAVAAAAPPSVAPPWTRPSDGSEYGSVIRVTLDIKIGPDQSFVSETEPAAVCEYARNTTLARGRILQEVWNQYTPEVVGYIVPAAIFAEAKRVVNPANSAQAFTYEERTAIAHIRVLLRQDFPGLRDLDARLIAEGMVSQKKYLRKGDLEEAVVDWARRKHTSYDRQCDSIEAGTDSRTYPEVKESVKAKIREVVTKWLSMDFTRRDMIGLWRRTGMMDAEGSGGDMTESKVVYGRWSVDNVPGATTLNQWWREDYFY